MGAVKRQREKVEQAHGVQLLRVLGAAVYVSGTRRKRGDFQGTMQSPGIPDVEAWLDGTRVGFPGVRVLLKWEVKAAGGRLSPEQLEYQRLCSAADVRYLVGDYDALIAWLIVQGHAKPEQFPTYRRPGPSGKPADSGRPSGTRSVS